MKTLKDLGPEHYAIYKYILHNPKYFSTLKENWTTPYIVIPINSNPTIDINIYTWQPNFTACWCGQKGCSAMIAIISDNDDPYLSLMSPILHVPLEDPDILEKIDEWVLQTIADNKEIKNLKDNTIGTL